MTTLRLVLLLLVCFLSSMTNAQEKLFEDLSYKQALKKSSTLKKPVLLFYEMDDNEKWNEIIPKALSEPDRARLINDHFISIKVSLESRDRIIIQDVVNPQVPFSLYFLDEEGSLLPFLKSPTPVSMDSVIKYALKTYQNRALVQQIEKTYFDKGNKNIDDLKKMIQAKTDLGLDTKLLLTEFINLLPQDSLNTVSVTRFLMRQSPAFGSNAYQKAVNNPNFSEAWWPMPLQERVNINRRIIKKSVNIAIANRDMNYAKRVVQFARSTCNTEREKLYVERTVLMDYYIHTGDTARYLEIASVFNDDYAVASKQAGIATADSIEEVDPNIPERLRQLNIPKAVRVAVRSPQSIYLNSAANYFYRVDREKRYLKQAVSWAAQSVALYPDYMNRHTYALLLYKSGNKQDAIDMETLAIESAREKQVNFASKWEAILQKMKDGEEIN